MASLILTAALGLFVAFLAVSILKQKRARKHLPPGPAGNWLVGNLFDMPTEYAWLEFTKWKALYGDVVYAHILGQELVILNSMEAVNDLLDTRSQNYSDRPVFTMVGELMKAENLMVLKQHGTEWRSDRRFTHLALNTDAVKQYHAIQEQHVHTYLQNLLERPEEFMHDLHRTLGRITVSVAYGIPVQRMEPYVQEAEETMDFLSRSMTPGRFLVDAFPILKYVPSWIPGSPHQVGEKGRIHIHKMMQRPIDYVKNGMASGKYIPSFSSELLTKLRREANTTSVDPEAATKWNAGGLFTAGVETSYTPILSFIIAMCQNPDIQRDVQEELDSVVSQDRLPQVQDGEDLPYLTAVVRETMRWKPSLPLSIPRASRAADEYKGYHIPGKATITPNLWAISREQCGSFPPEEFNPERFLKDGASIADPFDYIFGFGKRSCPGRKLGLNNIMLICSSVLSAFDIVPVPDENGKLTPPDPKYVNGLASYPESFKVAFRPRSQQVAKLIHDIAVVATA